MDTPMGVLAGFASIVVSSLSFFPIYALYRCAVAPINFAAKAAFMLLMLLFWPWGFLVYAFTLGRERVLQTGALFISLVIIVSFVYAGIWNRRVKEGEDPKKDVWGVIAYVSTVNTINSLTRPVYYYKVLTGQVKNPAGGMSPLQGKTYRSTVTAGSGGVSRTSSYSSDESSEKDSGGFRLDKVKLGPVTEEQRRKLPQKLEVEFEGGVRFPVDMGSGERDSRLIQAVREGDMNVVRELVRLGAGPSALSDSGYTPLMEAVQYGYEDIARFLIESGADINYQAEDGETALTLAQKNFRKETEAFLSKRLRQQ